ncbi:hypothetical protein AAH248_004981 [Klebsiella michiganensis]
MKVNSENKNSLPGRLYYPIDIAAKKLGCSAKDIFHFAATESIRLCFYCDLEPNDDTGRMIMHTPFGFDDEIGTATRVIDEHWSISFSQESKIIKGMGTGYEIDKIMGFFHIGPIDCIELEFTGEDDFFTVNGVSTHPDITSEESLVVLIEKGLRVSKKYLCVMSEQLESIQENPTFPLMEESSKTIAKKGELIKSLLGLIDDLSGIDLDTTPVSKIVNIVEASAAKKGIAIPDTHRQTWQKYLGR